MNDLVVDVALAELESVLHHRQLRRVFVHPAAELLRAFAKPLGEHSMKVPRRDDLRALRVQSAIAHAHAMDGVHQLGDQKKAKARLSEAGDAPLRRVQDPRVFDRVLDGVLVRHKPGER